MSTRLIRSALLLVTLVPCLNHAEASDSSGAQDQARLVMDEFMNAFNARDKVRWAETLLFPHVRIASSGVTVTPTREEFVADMDFEAFAARFNWRHSRWDSIEAVHVGPDKVHFKVVFTRVNQQNEAYASFDSLYVLQRVNGRWGIRARSSFAP
ncbi:MAG: hypothetical protein AAF529_13400 [Pseudomonadota bacterium]